MSKSYFIYKKVVCFFVVFSFCFCFVPVEYSSAQEPSSDDYGLETTINKLPGPMKQGIKNKSIGNIVGIIIKFVLGFVGVAFISLMIYGGVLWGTAQGAEQQVQKAIDLIKWSVIGFGVVASAYGLTKYITGIAEKIVK